MTTLSVREAQKGLVVWYEEISEPEDRAVDPGRVDGLWGPATHEALRAYVAVRAPAYGLSAPRELAPLRSTPARATSIELHPRLALYLRDMAVLYPPPSRRTAPAPSEPADTETEPEPPETEPPELPADSTPPPDGTAEETEQRPPAPKQRYPTVEYRKRSRVGPTLFVGAAALGGILFAFAWKRRRE